MNNAVGYARPAERPNPVVLGTDGIGADMLEEFRLAYARLREDDVAGHARDGVARGSTTGYDLVPEAADDEVTLELRPRRLARGTSPSPPASAPSTWSIDGEVVLAGRPGDPRRRRRGPGQGRRAGGPALRPPVSTRDCTDDTGYAFDDGHRAVRR